MRKTTGLLSVLVLGAAVAGPVASAHAAPAAAASCHSLVVKANSANGKALSADGAHSYKKAIGYNQATQKYAVQGQGACRHARHAEEIRDALRGAQQGARRAELNNKRAYYEHDPRAGRAAFNDEEDVKVRMRNALRHV
ncbi:hypothetical protein RM550_05510 [Streptomyces sp. DSM 41527]|uniref:DUF4189 domain-containing protein n=1 Tax=Streptomyces mooreae TaxID=3075523 RepID=A0ABU2T277_9ACTN|nr:hypothetical protein [Streptomyces sp. DSM 41527]MDT0455197.1 hypothetical protein [Streptomyces sp. DSM 41527]